MGGTIAAQSRLGSGETNTGAAATGDSATVADGLIQQQQFEIDLEEPQQVGRNPLEAVRSLEISGKTAETLDPSRLMIEAFGREDIGGKLLILGAPGAGKTTMLLSLAEQLVVGALQNPQTTIPIVFELSTWKDDGQSIRDWLVEQLYESFGGKRKVWAVARSGGAVAVAGWAG